MERNPDTPDTELDALATPVRSDGVRSTAATPSPQPGSRLLSGWRFMRHLLEMVAAMMLGMGVFGLMIAVMGEPPGYTNLLVEYGLMGAFMAAPMVGWMRFRGHSWRDGGEMSAAMLGPMLAPVSLVELGVAVPGITEESLMLLSHVAMIGGMVALMLYRFDRYSHGARDRHGEDDARTNRATNAEKTRG